MTYRLEGLHFAVWAILGTMAAVAFAGNVIVIIIIATGRRIRGNRSMFVMVFNLALSDVIFAGVSIPLTLASTTIKDDWSLGNIGCKLVMFLPNFCVAATMFTLCIIAYDRRVAINTGAMGNSDRKLTYATVATALVWLASLVVAAPALYEYSVYTRTVVVGEEPSSSSEEVDSHEAAHSGELRGTGRPLNVTTYRSCGSHGIVESFEKVYATLLTFTIYLFPLVFISVNYVLILAYIWKKEKELKQNMNSSGAQQKQPVVSSNTARVLKMLIAVIAVFTVAWAPYFVLFFREEVTGSDDTANFGDTLHVIKLVMALSSSVLNPVIYGVFNSRIRRGFFSLFWCFRCSQSMSSVEPESTAVARTQVTNSS